MWPVRAIGRPLFAHPVALAGGVLASAAVSAIVWYLVSPLFVRTFMNEPLPSPASVPVTSAGSPTSGETASPTESPVGARVLRSGELGYVDAIHNGMGPVRIIEIGGRRFVRFEDVTLTNAPDVHVYLSRETGGRWSEETSSTWEPSRRRTAPLTTSSPRPSMSRSTGASWSGAAPSAF